MALSKGMVSMKEGIFPLFPCLGMGDVLRDVRPRDGIVFRTDLFYWYF